MPPPPARHRAPRHARTTGLAVLVLLAAAACTGSKDGSPARAGGDGDGDSGTGGNEGSGGIGPFDGGTGGSQGTGGGGGGDGDDGGDAVCGDGVLHDDEVCDDGNLDSGDGCDDDCQTINPGYACPTQGVSCVRVVVCGNGRIEGDETCDDRDTAAGDGCDDACKVEAGWTCPLAGAACIASACGDGLVAGFEACDDGNTDVNDGCDDGCRLEEGYACPNPGQSCIMTTCGDGATEGTEECDDGNPDVGDGCSPLCKQEPDCQDGSCTAVCGDGFIWAPETCDDGNTLSGDGCSAACEVETGFTCTEVAQAAPAEVELPITLRDFITACGGGSRLPDDDINAVPPYGHRDFQCYNNGLRPGMVTGMLKPNGKPQWVASDSTYSEASFDLWYVSNPDYNRAHSTTIVLPSIGNGAYQRAGSFFPLDALGFVVEDCGGSPCEPLRDNSHNFHFTSEVRYWFQYGGNEVLDFTGDDDVWVFINGRLAVDIGGVHGAENGSVDLSNGAVATQLGLTIGGIYEAVVFQAERHTSQSNYRLTLTNFTRTPSSCVSECGDGVVSSVEVCDDGVNDGSYGGCMPDCTLAPYCGDGVVQDGEGELCDDGLNLGGQAGDCSPGCKTMGASCGDGVVQPGNDEQCDDGNETSGDGCSAECYIEPS